jgi:hypothetical protein
MSSAGACEWLYYRDGVQWLNYDAANYEVGIQGTNSSVSMSASGLYGGRVNTTGDYAGMVNYKTGGVATASWGLEAGHGSAWLNTSAGVRNIYMNANGWCSFNRNTSIGKDYNTAPVARLEVIGSGSTSATTTALFQNSSSVAILTITDDKKVLFGTQITLDATGVNVTAIQQNLALASDYAHIVYNNAGNGVYYLSKNGVIESYYPSGGSCLINFNSFINFWSKSIGDNFAYYSTNSDSLMTFQVRNESKIGTVSIGNALGATQTFLKGGNGSYHLNDLAIGATSISAQFGVKGTGSTSATTTALFQNSSSVAILTITDDKVATFGGRVISISAPIQLNTASSATPTPNADADGQFNLTALAANATFGAPTGTPTGGQKLMIRIKDNGTARTLAYNAIYRAIGITLPTTTVISKTLYIACIYNAADTKWDAIATAQEA